MKREAFGEIGLTPEVFYKMAPSDYALLVEGHNKKRIYEQRLLREAVFRIVSPWLSKVPDIFRWWPIEGDDEIKKLIEKEKIKISESAMARLMKLKELELQKNNSRPN